MFGLAQLYQLRGRVGRSKLRAYALFTLPAQQKITAQAERRLKVLQSLETLGAGFQLASHDLDIRGAGNLLGEEQSGHIKEVGFELYQSMLEEAIVNLKAGVAEPAADRWSPQITIGMPVLIPEDDVSDLSVRLSLYRRLADLDTDEEIDNFAAEMRDRFGVLPDEVRYLFKVAAIKAYCRRANVEKVDAGPKGAVITFRDNKLRATGPAGRIYPPARPGGAGAARHEGGVLPGLGNAGGAVDGHHGDLAAARQSRGGQEGGLAQSNRRWANAPTHPPRCKPTGARKCAPDDMLREAIHLATQGRMDCFVASLLETMNSRRRCHRRPLSGQLRPAVTSDT